MKVADTTTGVEEQLGAVDEFVLAACPGGDTGMWEREIPLAFLADLVLEPDAQPAAVRLVIREAIEVAFWRGFHLAAEGPTS